MVNYICTAHTYYNGVLTILGLVRFFVFCVSVKVKLSVLLLCVCVHSAWEGRPRNDLYCVERDVKPYSLTHSHSLHMSVSGLILKSHITKVVMHYEYSWLRSVHFRCSQNCSVFLHLSAETKTKPNQTESWSTSNNKQ